MSARNGASGISKEDPEADKKLLGKRKEVLVGILRRYLNHPDTKHDHIDALRDALLPKISYLSDIDARLELAKSWCRSSHSAYCKYHRRDFEVVDKLAWASLMMAPMEAIRKFHDEECTDDGYPSQSDMCYLGESAIFLSRMIGELFPKRGYLPAHHYEPKDGLNAVEVKDHPRGDIKQAISLATVFSLANMISLNQILSKCVGRLESVRGSYAKVVCIDMDPRMVSRERLTQSGKSLRMVHFETRESVEDGYEFDITAAKKEDLPDFGLLKVRYILSIALSPTGEGLAEDDQH
ncbi:hypothetical protein CABS01_10953 [Colletotrichum abscissum]|uniref:Uncharacterized protein n=1 Tax=Colletotrichum abscissum TaxID=1671311 RepID=A0A9P9XEL5_9PEZI|nr:uncharacterized protein CABS01_10953 [Colletotrichum abscissum]KAI3552986.1 hypothetical protein CABS02_06764 [Colletotrichum abscissum]KAK1496804.1 hypothetical protein CABS01_10953 [Colletotrichum abscissum]